MGRGRHNYWYVIAGTGIMISLFFFIYNYYPTFNIDATVGQSLFTLLPGFIITTVCIYVTAGASGVGRLGGCIGLGIGLSYLLDAVDGLGLITVEMLSGLTVPQVQLWTMILATLMGAIMYGTSR